MGFVLTGYVLKGKGKARAESEDEEACESSESEESNSSSPSLNETASHDETDKVLQIGHYPKPKQTLVLKPRPTPKVMVGL